MPRSYTATSITLIPKNDSPQSWSNLRPISLCNVTNKILSKFLYNKFAHALPDLISPSESGFVPVSLLAYVHDVIIFTRCAKGALLKLMQFLERFEEISGQKINNSKISSIPSKKANLVVHRIKSLTGFALKSLSFTYLGAALFKGNKKNVLPSLRKS
ncbi:UNVERIFIED_CONTAM: hypothetical protein Slati_4260100 [Sesamum latifolium]|uniref:Reverse transcriptase domain-containing protein n=1 Tax=Sesamum latifolium TaxID=2727402 RepID=A0AAW2TCD4_9LAMI